MDKSNSQKNFEINIHKIPNLKDYFLNMSLYLDEKIYFFGSILRQDFYINNSDIDISIFSNNLTSLKVKLQHFLKVGNENFKKIFWRLRNSKRIAQGYKIFYNDTTKNTNIEISIYDTKYKDEILLEHYSKVELPIHALIMLFIVKTLYYQLQIINKTNYNYFKKIILSYGIGYTHKDEFITI
jgi:predicted nucleotidyltransferase